MNLAVLRVYHSGVVNTWRQRERHMRAAGADVTLVTARRWNEGGADVRLGASHEPWVVPTRTFGRHPYLFLYNPLPIIKLLRRHRFDVIDVHEEPASLAALELRLLARRFGHRATPMLLYSAQNIDKRYPWPFRSIERTSLRRARGLYPCNLEAGRILQKKGFEGVVFELPLGIEASSFSSDRRQQGDEIVVGYVGRLAEHKGVHVAIQALAQLPEHIHLHLVGDGPYRQELRALAEQRGVTQRVKWLGHRSQHEVNALYPTFDVLVMPSQTRPSWIEQFGRVAVEAMASGVPVLVSDSGSLPTVVGDAGVVVPEGDVQAWATAIGDLVDHPHKRAALSEAGKQRALQFDWSTIAQQQLALYEAVRA